MDIIFFFLKIKGKLHILWSRVRNSYCIFHLKKVAPYEQNSRFCKILGEVMVYNLSSNLLERLILVQLSSMNDSFFIPYHL